MRGFLATSGIILYNFNVVLNPNYSGEKIITMIQLETIEQLQTFLDKNPHSVILKHSTSCSISARAYREFSALLSKSPSLSAIIMVIEARPVSNYLAEMSGVVHKSPQVLFFHNRQCYRNFSHYDITKDHIREIMEANS